MATLAVGDIQGCYRTLRRLLAQAGFHEGRDRLWLVGDLVNRGPRSLEVLRFVRGLGQDATVVLGNHDIHLLARAAGVRRARRKDTLNAVLGAPDAGDLLAWLRARPLLARAGRDVLVHGGLLPSWDVAGAQRWADAAAAALRADDRLLVPATPDRWHEDAAATIAVLTRLRVCSADGRLRFDFDGPPGRAPPGFAPWFALPHARGDVRVVCGHWSALGLHRAPGVLALDSGCVWGGPLSAVRLEDDALFQEPPAD